MVTRDTPYGSGATEGAVLAEKARLGRAISNSLTVWPAAAYRDALHAAAAADGVITADDYETYRSARTEPMPSLTAFLIRYGSWHHAAAVHGLSCGRTTRTYKRASNDDLAQDVATVIDALGHLPSVAEYDTYRREHPDRGLRSVALIRRRFSSWPLALRAGADARNRGA